MGEPGLQAGGSAAGLWQGSAQPLAEMSSQGHWAEGAALLWPKMSEEPVWKLVSGLVPEPTKDGTWMFLGSRPSERTDSLH